MVSAQKRSDTMIRAISSILAMALIGAIGQGPAAADSYPSHPVQIVVPIAAGGPLDLIARTIGEKLSEALKQPFIIEDRPGAGGNIGGKAVAGAAPDGYTLLLAFGQLVSVNPILYKNLGYDPRSLRPISIAATSNSMLVVHPSIPANNLAEFVSYAKQQPRSYAHSGVGTPSQLAMEYFRQRAGFDAVPVPYRGAAPLVTDLISGQIKIGFIATAAVINHVNDGRLKGLAISTTERSKFAPKIPTIAESGYPGFKVETPYVLVAPGGTPDSVIKILERETSKALKSPDVRDKIHLHKTEAVGSTAAEAVELLKADTKLWSGVIAAAKIEAR
jgi:tripartite-type tricarboxylate transporter receptor subunit TctC